MFLLSIYFLNFYRFVHGTCDSEADLTTYHQKKETNIEYEYVCLYCKNQAQQLGRQIIGKRTSKYKQEIILTMIYHQYLFILFD